MEALCPKNGMKTHPSWNEIEHVLSVIPRGETRLGLLLWSCSGRRLTQYRAAVKRFRKEINFARAKSYSRGRGANRVNVSLAHRFIKEVLTVVQISYSPRP